MRYPGSKDGVTKEILGRFPSHVIFPLFQKSRGMEYREPFVGGFAVGLAFVRKLPPESSVWLNDKDFAIACLWKSVYEQLDELLALVRSFVPSVAAFYEFKERDGEEDGDPVEVAFRKFALHQISFSGLGFKAGGPIGGRKQSSKYNVDCRWNADRHCRDLQNVRKILLRFGRPESKRVRITSGDFGRLIEGAPENAFIYADPPYYKEGPNLYRHSMSDDDHRRLASLLRGCRGSWVLSYDDNPFITDLYRWAHIESLEITYTTARSNGPRRKNSEIIITPSMATETA